jgi:hypothetical protein
MTRLQIGIMHRSFGVALFWAALVDAEPYIAGQAGVAFPQAL